MRLQDIKKTGRSKGINAKAGQQVYTDEDIMQYLRSMADRIGHVPVADEIRHDPNGVSFKTFYNRDPWSFRKWTIKTFGEKKAKRARWGNTGDVVKYSNADLVSYLQKLSNKLGKIPTSEEIRMDKEGPSFRIWYYRKPYSLKKWLFQIFGEFERKGNFKYTDEDLVEFLKKYHKEFGVVPTLEGLGRIESYPSQSSYLQRGGFGKFLKLAGFELNKINRYTEEVLIEKLKHIATKMRKSPTSGDMRRAHKRDASYPDLTSYIRLRSWKEWLELAGLPPVNLIKYSNDELELKLKEAGALFGRAPTSKEFDALEGFPGAFHYMKRGGWGNWLRRCDLHYERPDNWFRKKITTKDGHVVRSAEEAQIDDWLSDRKIYHEYEPFYPGQKKYKADFKVGDIYYEYCGLAGRYAKYDAKTQKKVDLAKQLNMRLVLFYREDLNNLEKIFNI